MYYLIPRFAKWTLWNDKKRYTSNCWKPNFDNPVTWGFVHSSPIKHYRLSLDTPLNPEVDVVIYSTAEQDIHYYDSIELGSQLFI